MYSNHRTVKEMEYPCLKELLDRWAPWLTLWKKHSVVVYPKLKTALSSQASLDERSAQNLELSILAKTNAIGMQTPVYGI